MSTLYLVSVLILINIMGLVGCKKNKSKNHGSSSQALEQTTELPEVTCKNTDEVYLQQLQRCIAKNHIVSDKVEFQGTVDTEIIALGGETTGVEISNNSERYELWFSEKDKENLEQWQGQEALVTGKLLEFSGIEINKRKIIVVETIESK